MRISEGKHGFTSRQPLCCHSSNRRPAIYTAPHACLVAAPTLRYDLSHDDVNTTQFPDYYYSSTDTLWSLELHDGLQSRLMADMTSYRLCLFVK